MTETAATRRSAVELLVQGVGLLDSRHFRELGLSQRAIEAIWASVGVVMLPGFARPLVPVEAYLALLAGHTYCDRCGDRVRPSGRGKRQP